MTERQIQGKWFSVANNGEIFKITKLELAGSKCSEFGEEDIFIF